MKESSARMEKIPSIMVLHKHLDVVDTIFSNMAVLLANTPWGGCIEVIRRGAYQAASEDSRWEYEPVYDLWPDIETDSYYSDDGSSD